MMQQNVGSARGAWPQHCANNAADAQFCFNHVGFEPLIEEINRAHGHYFGEVMKFLFTK